MKYRFLSFAVVALALTLSCGKEEPTGGTDGRPDAGETDKPEVLPPLDEGEVAFKAESEFFYEEDSDQADGVMLFMEDDSKAALWTTDGNEPAVATVTNTATSSWLIAQGDASKSYYAVYPSTVNHSLADGVMSVTIPETQDGTLSAASISLAVSTGEDAHFRFRNLCGLIKFSAASEDIKSVTFKGAGGEDLVGTVNVTGFDEETGTPAFGEVSDGKKEVTLELDGRTGIFYVALLPGLTLENGFAVSFEMKDGAQTVLDDAKSDYAVTFTRSGYNSFGNIVDYIPQYDWFVTPEGAGAKDGKSWETAISGEQMFQMLACNRPEESGNGNTTTDIASDANRETFADYIKVHNTRHVQQLDGVTFHIAQGEYSTQNYVRVSFPDLERKVRIGLRGGYDPTSSGKDMSSRDMKLYPTVFKAPSGSGTARMFFFQRWLDMTLDGLTFSGGLGDAGTGGGAILLNESSTSTFLFKDCTFSNNKSLSYGGAVNASNEVGQVSFTGCVFSNNSAAKSGGSFRITDGQWSFEDCEFDNNSCEQYGGAVYATGGVLDIKECVFAGNKGTESDSFGGALSAKTASLTCTECEFSSNTSVNNGGAVWLNAMTKADFTDCDFTSNECTQNLAGAICLSGANPLTITGGVFSGNKAAKGGGCFYNNAASTINITGAEFKNNESSTFGGVFYGNDKATDAVITIADAAFSGNKANKGEAGAIFFKSGEWNVTDTKFENNTATSNGGAVYAHTGTLTLENATFSGNESGGGAGGGAVYVTTDGVLSASGSTFSLNKSPNGNGAVTVANTADRAIHKISNCVFSGNTAKQGAALRTAYTVYVNGCSFTGNTPSNTNTGGTVYVAAASFINNCSFYGYNGSSNNTSLVISGGMSTVLNTTIYEDSAKATAVRLYNSGTSANIYNNVIIAGSNSVAAGWGDLTGSVKSCGYNYTRAWTTGAYSGIAASASTISTDTVVTDPALFTSASTTDGRGYYTWTKPAEVTGTTAENVTAFLNGITGGGDFATWLGTVGGLTHDIAGNPRPETGWYPGCYQKGQDL